MASVENTKTIVIIGGGYAGITLIKELEKKNLRNLNLVLISKTNYFYHNVASPRTLVDESLISQIIIPYDKITQGNNKRFIHGKVTKIGSYEIAYNPIENESEKQEERLAFDYLVLALGSSYSEPFHGNIYDSKHQESLLKDLNNKLKSANRILIVGGGPVGVETAGEIATDKPHKKVILITNGDRLVSNMSPSFSQKTLNVLKDKKVEVIFNDLIDLKNVPNYTSQKLRTKNGKEVEFDAYYVCYGAKPCTDIIKSSFPEWVNEIGQVKVNKYFQVFNNQNIFAIGDCCDTEEAKVSYLASVHGGVVANNIELLLNGKSKLKEYTVNSADVMLVSIGRDNGVFQFNCLTVGGFLPKQFKSKDLFVSKTKGNLGYK